LIASRGEETGALAGPRVVGETDRQASIVKGIGMILVVCGHCNGAFDFFPFLPYSFHMPLFYFVSGYLSKTNTLQLHCA
jgi:fucose 4-O-acetylase-like acetyltransferase